MLYNRWIAWFAVAALTLALLPQSRMAATPRQPASKPITAAESFEMHFHTPLPKGVRVVHYYGDTFGMDPSFAWELTPVNDALLKRLVRNAGLKRAPAARRPNPNVYQWPAWWNKNHIAIIQEVYAREEQGLVRVWVDRSSKRLFIEWINT